jgi:flagellar biosynthesis/type III secretory pathway M-ring protein FliF/YscJ
MALVVFLVIRPMMKWVTTRSVRVVDHGRLSSASMDEMEQIEGESNPQLEAGAKSEEMKRAVQGKRKIIESKTKNDPNTATAVVKSWLQENV